MSNNTREDRTPIWDEDTRSLAATIDDVIEIGENNKKLLKRGRKRSKHFIQQMEYAPEGVTEEQKRGLALYVYWHLKQNLELKWSSKDQDSNSELTPKKPATRRQKTRSTTKSVVEHAFSPKNQLETIADNVETLQKALRGDLKSRFNLLLKEWENAKPDSDGFKDGTTPAKNGALFNTKDVHDNQIITTHHLRFSAFFYGVGPETLKKIKKSTSRGNTDGIDRILAFMVEQFEKVATGMKSIFDALDSYDLNYEDAITDSSYGVIILCTLKSDPENVVAVVKNFLTEVDEVDGKKVDQSTTDIHNEIDLMHKVAHGQGGKFFIKPLDWKVGPIAPYLVMEPIHGGNVEDFIKDLADEKRLELLPLFAKTLAASVLTLHEKGIIHRDIKLENLMLRVAGDIGSLVVVDLGLGTKVKVDDTGFPSEGVGTSEFMAPECWLMNGQIKTNKVDIFSAGMALIEFTLGIADFRDVSKHTNRDRFTGAFFDRTQLEEELDHLKLPPQMIDLLDGMTKTDPNKRLSAQEWLNHPALQDVPNPLELTEDVPANANEASPPQDNIEQLEEKLKKANQRAAEAEEKAAYLQAKNDELEKRSSTEAKELATQLAKMDLQPATAEGTSELRARLSSLEEAQTQAQVHAGSSAPFPADSSVAAIKNLQDDIGVSVADAELVELAESLFCVDFENICWFIVPPKLLGANAFAFGSLLVFAAMMGNTFPLFESSGSGTLDTFVEALDATDAQHKKLPGKLLSKAKFKYTPYYQKYKHEKLDKKRKSQWAQHAQEAQESIVAKIRSLPRLAAGTMKPSDAKAQIQRIVVDVFASSNGFNGEGNASFLPSDAAALSDEEVAKCKVKVPKKYFERVALYIWAAYMHLRIEGDETDGAVAADDNANSEAGKESAVVSNDGEGGDGKDDGELAAVDEEEMEE